MAVCFDFLDSTGAVGARTCRSLGHHLLHPLILGPRALFYRTDCTRRSKFLTHALNHEGTLGFPKPYSINIVRKKPKKLFSSSHNLNRVTHRYQRIDKKAKFIISK